VGQALDARDSRRIELIARDGGQADRRVLHRRIEALRGDHHLGETAVIGIRRHHGPRRGKAPGEPANYQDVNITHLDPIP
jgi:hypothetical protein